jgi:putative FmdB family regulatory protein
MRQNGAMPRYEYRCTTCDDRFEVWKSMAEADDATHCGSGHVAKRLLSVFAASGFASNGPAPAASPAPRMGGCGSACGCH